MAILQAAALGLAFGVAYGFVLEKSRVFEPGIVIGQMQLRNFTLIKVWLTAIVTALLGVTLLNELDILQLQPKPAVYVADIVGGLIGGIGLTLAGGCPAMVMAQIGAGYRDALWTLFGGLTGAAVLTLTEPTLRPWLGEDAGNLTVADVSTMPFVAWGVAAIVVLFACIMVLERLRPWRLDLGANADGLHERPAPLDRRPELTN